MPIHKFLFRNCGGSALHLSDDMQLFGISGSYFCGKVKSSLHGMLGITACILEKFL